MVNNIMEWIAVCGHRGGGAAQCTVTVNASPSGFGYATGGGTFSCGRVIFLQARAHWGYRFREWTENGAVVGTAPTLQVTLDAAQVPHRTFTAVFELDPAVGGGTTPPPDQSPGTPAPVDPGGRFTSTTCPHCAARLWARAPGGNALWSTLPCPNCGRNITFWGQRFDRLHMASAQEATFEIVTRASPVTGGSVSGGGAYSRGQTARVRAVPNAGFTFDGWYEHGQRVSSSTDYGHMVSGVATLTARFTRVPLPSPVPQEPSPTPQQPSPTPQQPLPIPQEPSPIPRYRPNGRTAPVGMTTGTIIALAAGGAAVVGTALWLVLRRRR